MWNGACPPAPNTLRDLYSNLLIEALDRIAAYFGVRHRELEVNAVLVNVKHVFDERLLHA